MSIEVVGSTIENRSVAEILWYERPQLEILKALDTFSPLPFCTRVASRLFSMNFPQLDHCDRSQVAWKSCWGGEDSFEEE